MDSENTSPAQEVVQGLVDNVKGKVTSHLYGWVLNAVGLGGGSDPVLDQLQVIQQKLDVIHDQLVALQKQVEEAKTEIIHVVEWTSATSAISDAVNRITSKFNDLRTLDKADSAGAKRITDATLDENLGAFPDLLKIHTFILNSEGGLSPDQPGLLQMWIDANDGNALKDFQRGNYGRNTPLDLAAHRITQYFIYLVVLQLKGLTLLVNAFTALKQPVEAQKCIDTYRDRITTQGDIYRRGLEKLVVDYCYDQTLFGLFGNGREWQTSPLLLADQTVCGLLAQDELLVRIWGGRATSGFTFDTGTLVTDPSQAGPQLLLTGAGTSVSATPPNGELTIFPANKGAQWSMYRYRFLRPPAGNFTISPGMPNPPFYNCHIATGHLSAYWRDNPEIVIPGGGWPSSSIPVTLTMVPEE